MTVYVVFLSIYNLLVLVTTIVNGHLVGFHIWLKANSLTTFEYIWRLRDKTSNAEKEKKVKVRQRRRKENPTHASSTRVAPELALDTDNTSANYTIQDISDDIGADETKFENETDERVIN